MRQSIALVLLAAACGGAELDETSSALASECRGFKSAHCFCKVLGGPVMTPGPPDSIIPIHIEGQELFAYRIPGKCYNQQEDLWNSHFDRGCWRDCRDAFGVEGHAIDPAVAQLKADE